MKEQDPVINSRGRVARLLRLRLRHWLLCDWSSVVRNRAGGSRPRRVSACSLFRLWLVLLAALAAPGQAIAQLRNRGIEDPKWLTLRITEASIGVYSEATSEETIFKNFGGSVLHNRLFVGPTLGLNAEG